MVRLINGWTKAAVISRLTQHCGELERSPELLVTSEGKCCAIGALLPDDARAALQKWDKKIAAAYASPFSDPTGFTIVHLYLDDASPGWREHLPFELGESHKLPHQWGMLMSNFDGAGLSKKRPLDVALAWVEQYVEE